MEEARAQEAQVAAAIRAVAQAETAGGRAHSPGDDKDLGAGAPTKETLTTYRYKILRKYWLRCHQVLFLLLFGLSSGVQPSALVRAYHAHVLI